MRGKEGGREWKREGEMEENKEGCKEKGGKESEGEGP